MKGKDTELQAHIQQLEERLLQQATRQESSILQALLADDFVEFGVSGGAWNKGEVIDALKNEPFLARTISEFQIRMLAQDVVLATYRCCGHTASGMIDTTSLRSSIWRRHAQRWQMVFHQGTRVST